MTERERRGNQGDDGVLGPGGTATRYRLRERLLSVGDDYWVEDADGKRAFRVDGKALRLRRTLDLEDASGQQLCRIQSRMLHLRETMAIERPDGAPVATVHKALVSPLRERWKVDVADGEDLAVQGNIVDHEYRIEQNGRKVAEASRRWFRVRDTYGVQIAPEVDVPLVLAVTVALDVMNSRD